MSTHIFNTRLHSSRMRTSRSLTVSPSMLLWGVSALGGICSRGYLLRRSAPGGCLLPARCLFLGVSAPRGCLLWEVSALGGVCSRGVSAPGGGCLLRGLSAPGGVCSGGCIPASTEADTPPPCEQNHTRL